MEAVMTSSKEVLTNQHQSLAKMLWRRKGFILLIAIVLTSCVITVALLLPKTYRAEAILLIEERSGKPLGSQMLALDMDPEGGVMASQADLIKSPRLVLSVIESLHLLESQEFQDIRSPFSLADLASSALKLLPSGLAASLPEELLVRLADDGPADPAVEKAKREEAALSFFLSRLGVAFQQHGRTLRISYRSGDPATAMKAVNTLAQTYIDDQMNAKIEAIQVASGWLTERLQALRAQAEESESRVVEFRRENSLGTEQAPAFTQQQLSDLNGQLVAATAQLAHATARLRQAETAARSGRLEASPDVLSSRTVQDLRQQEAEANRRVAEASMSYGPLHPTIAKSKAEIADIRSRITEETQRIMTAINGETEISQARLNSIERRIALLRTSVDARAKADIQAGILEREAEANRAVFDALVRKAEETTAIDSLQRPDVRIASAARLPGSPFSPKLGLIGSIGLAASLLAAAAMALLLEYLKGTVRSLTHGEQTLGVPALGWVPEIRRGRTSVHELVVSAPHHIYSEAFRSLAIGIKSLFRNDRLVVLISSSTAGEGKTSFALSYARTIALAGQSCLLIDADLRRAAIGERLGALHDTGLTDIIDGSVTLKDAVQVDPASGLSYLAAGATFGDPLRHLDNATFSAVIKEARERFQTVIIDAPPLLAVADAGMLARHADLALVLVRWESTPARLIAKTMERFHQSGSPAVSFVLSRVDTKRLSRSDMERYNLDYRRSSSSLHRPAIRLSSTISHRESA